MLEHMTIANRLVRWGNGDEKVCVFSWILAILYHRRDPITHLEATMFLAFERLFGHRRLLAARMRLMLERFFGCWRCRILL
jgi:hypothetical protein